MFQWKKVSVLVLASSLISCSWFSKKDEEEARKAKESENLSIYDVPSKVDFVKSARLNIELGLGYLKQNQVPRAKSKFLRALKLAPQLPEVHYAYAFFQEKTGDIENAEKAYLKAISINSKDGTAHNNYGAFLCRQKDYRKAEKEFLKAIADPNYTQTGHALENAGLCLLQVPDEAKAIEYFERAIRNDPTRTNALIELALSHYRAGRYWESQQYLSRFSQESEATARSLLLAIELAKQEGDKDKVASYELMLKSHFPNAKPSDLMQLAMGG